MIKNNLNMIENARLVGYIEKNYKLFCITDEAFAKKAEKDLGFHVVLGNVRTRREALGIEATYEFGGARKPRADAVLQFQEYVAALEKRITALEKVVMELTMGGQKGSK